MKLYRLASGLVALGMFLLSTGTTFASHGGTVVLVDDSDTTSDAGGCGNAANPCNTIQTGVNHASAGQTVRVAPGVYPEVVSVTKALTLQGAQAGNDARTRSGSESVVGVSGGGFYLAANNITVNGFTVQNVTNPFYNGAGIYTATLGSDYRIVNNIILNNTQGLYLNSNGAMQNVVRHNLFRNNNASGAASGRAISSAAGLHNTNINDNTFRGHNFGSITLAGNQSDITIARNTARNERQFLYLYNTTNSRVHDNDVQNFQSNSYGMILVGSNNNVRFADNIVRGASLDGMNIQNNFGFNTNLTITGNTIAQNGEHGIRTSNSALTNSLITWNEIRNNGATLNGDGILMNPGNTNNTFQNNTLLGNTHHDAHDNTVGSGTAGTANIWNSNTCATSQPAGLCD